MGWSQADLAKAAGFKHAQQISHYETGYRNMGPNTRKRLSRAFGLPLSEFNRMLDSEGRPEVIRTWIKLHEINNHNDADHLLRGFQAIIRLYQTAQDNPERQDVLEHLMRQIDMLDKLISE